MTDLPPLRIGVAGLGRAFSLMLPTFLGDARVALVAASDPRAAAREQFTRDFGGPAYADVESLARHPGVQAVYVASPHQFHAAHTALAAAHGKHVLVEKPMALSLDACDAMIEACRAASVQLLVGHCHSFDTPYLKTRELIAGGRFGAVRMVLALNYTDYLLRPRRPEELDTRQGGGAVFSQAAHQVDIVRLLAGSPAVRLRSALGDWDRQRPTEGAYSALLWFASGAHAALSYSGYAHFDSDQWMDGIGEMGLPKDPLGHGSARRKLLAIGSPEAEARLKAAGTYGGSAYAPPPAGAPAGMAHQHFGPIVVSCERADLRPTPHGVWIDGDERRDFVPWPPPRVPRQEVIDELLQAIRHGRPPLHDGRWARATLEICLAMLASARSGRDARLRHQV